MHRPLKTLLPLSVVLLAVAAALLVASSATGRSQDAPKNTQEPFIGAPYLVQVGTTLQGHRGSWTGASSYAYHWLRCNNNAEACKKISNATGTAYTAVSADQGHTIRFQVTASNGSGSTTVASNATNQITAKPGAPLEAEPPVISGQAVVGAKLAATTGSWRGDAPISYQFKWQTCNAAGTACPANGATGSTYTVKANDVGERVRVKVVASNGAGQSAGLSEPTDVVKEQSGGSVAVGSLQAGDRLVVEAVHFSPNPVTSKSTPIQVTISITDQKGNPVRGALVSMVSTPVVTSSPTPAQTDSNGTVAYTIHPESDFPIKNGYSVQFYVKGYRSGDPTLGGVSGGRLVQVATKTQ